MDFAFGILAARVKQGVMRAELFADHAAMGSTRLETNYKIWAAVIAQNTINADTLWLVTYAGTEMRAVQTGRNNFIHSVYREEGGIFDREIFDPAIFDTGTIKARRVKGSNEVDLIEYRHLLNGPLAYPVSSLT